jgi:hypothetical protein
MKRPALVLTVLLAAACRKAAAPPKEEAAVPTRAIAAGAALVDYEAATGEFSCLAPGEWRTLEDKSIGPRVMFFGPGDARHPNSVAISIMKYPGDGRIRTPQDFWDSLKLSDQNPSPLAARAVNGRTDYALHYALTQRPVHGRKALDVKREDVVLIPVDDGFFAISHSAPAETYERTLPIFEAVVASFRPKS